VLIAPGPVAVVGLGAMGLPMARRLLEAGFDVRGYDNNEDACARLAHLGGQAATSAADVARDAAALLVVVVNADQAEDVLFGPEGAAPVMAPGGVVILSLTMAPGRAVDLGKRLARHGLLMLDCPVSGGVKRATSGSLSILASGPAAAMTAARPYLGVLGNRTFEIGPEHGQASSVKLLNQALCGVHLAVAAEVVALAERAGVDRRMLYDVVVASSGTSWMFVDRVPRMLNADETATAAIDILVKDLELVAEFGRTVDASLALSRLAGELFAAASAAGMGARNDSDIVDYLRKT
jgi:L-threonate 2-dehydrogenase